MPRRLLAPVVALALLAGCAEENTTEKVVPPTTTARLENVDVTVVYPLGDGLLDASLLPRAVFGDAGLPELDALDPIANVEAAWASLRVVAVRFDPCPGVVLPPKPDDACAPVMRLVFQSLGANGARDGAIHAFFQLDDAAFTGALDALAALRAADPTPASVPLGVHPALARDGLDGPFARALGDLVRADATPTALTRVTHFRRAKDATYVFRRRDLVGGSWVDAQIPTTWIDEQSLAIATADADATITPAITGDDDPTAALHGPATAIGNLARVLNPRVRSSETIDCASCHATPTVAAFALAARDLSIAGSPDRFTSDESLAVASPTPAGDVHLLSYVGTTLAIGDRTANETAAILEIVNASR